MLTVAQVRLKIPDTLISQIQHKIGSPIGADDIAEDAIALLKWAVEERSKGRVILSSTESGDGVTRLVMPILERAAARRLERMALRTGTAFDGGRDVAVGAKGKFLNHLFS